MRPSTYPKGFSKEDFIIFRQEQELSSGMRSVCKPAMESPPRLKSGNVVTRRAHIQNEIISSEETYVKELRTLVTVFLRPLEKWVAEGVGGLPIAAEGVSSIFGNVEQILNFSKDLLKELRLSNEELKPIGTTFIKKANLFEVYSTYVINYPKGLRRLGECEAFPHFKLFIRACELQDVCHGLDLRSYLIQPVQRVPRYRLLLSELLKHTEHTHPDWVDLKTALENISNATSQLNESARDYERFMRVQELQEEFKDTFVQSSRYLVKEGYIMKVCSSGPRQYKLVLFNDMLVYGTEVMRVKLLKDTNRNSRRYKVHDKFPVHECFVLDLDGSIAFVVARPRSKSFVAMVASTEEKQEWIDAFGECFATIQEAEQQRSQNLHQIHPHMDSECFSPSIENENTPIRRCFSLDSGQEASDERNTTCSTLGNREYTEKPSVTRVQVWIPVDGRTELHEVSLHGLPPGSSRGIFKVEREEDHKLDSSCTRELATSGSRNGSNHQPFASSGGGFYRRMSGSGAFGSFRQLYRRESSEYSQSSRTRSRTPSPCKQHLSPEECMPSDTWVGKSGETEGNIAPVIARVFDNSPAASQRSGRSPTFSPGSQRGGASDDAELSLADDGSLSRSAEKSSNFDEDSDEEIVKGRPGEETEVVVQDRPTSITRKKKTIWNVIGERTSAQCVRVPSVLVPSTPAKFEGCSPSSRAESFANAQTPDALAETPASTESFGFVVAKKGRPPLFARKRTPSSSSPKGRSAEDSVISVDSSTSASTPTPSRALGMMRRTWRRGQNTEIDVQAIGDVKSLKLAREESGNNKMHAGAPNDRRPVSEPSRRPTSPTSCLSNDGECTGRFLGAVQNTLWNTISRTRSAPLLELEDVALGFSKATMNGGDKGGDPNMTPHRARELEERLQPTNRAPMSPDAGITYSGRRFSTESSFPLKLLSKNPFCMIEDRSFLVCPESSPSAASTEACDARYEDADVVLQDGHTPVDEDRELSIGDAAKG